MRALARWCIAHRRMVIVTWIVVLVGANVAGQAAGSTYNSNFTGPRTSGSQEALDLLAKSFPVRRGDSASIVFDASAPVTSAAVRGEIDALLSKIAALPHVSGVVSPYGASASAISADGHIAYASVLFDGRSFALPTGAINRVIDTAQAARTPTLEIQLGGAPIEQVEPPKTGPATIIGILAAMIILLVTFGTVVAAGLPLITALLALGTAIGLIALMTHVLRRRQLHARAGGDDRPGRRHRLRTVRGHALPQRPRRGPRARRGDRHGNGYLRTGRPVRRHHGRDRDARPASGRRELPARPRDRVVAHRPADDGRGADAAPGRPLEDRPGNRPVASGRLGPAHSGRPWLLGALGGDDPAPAPDRRACRRWRSCWHLPRRSWRCGSGRPMPGPMRRARQRDRPTTCSPRASVPASTGRCRSSSQLPSSRRRGCGCSAALWHRRAARRRRRRSGGLQPRRAYRCDQRVSQDRARRPRRRRRCSTGCATR